MTRRLRQGTELLVTCDFLESPLGLHDEHSLIRHL